LFKFIQGKTRGITRINIEYHAMRLIMHWISAFMGCHNWVYNMVAEEWNLDKVFQNIKWMWRLNCIFEIKFFLFSEKKYKSFDELYMNHFTFLINWVIDCDKRHSSIKLMGFCSASILIELNLCCIIEFDSLALNYYHNNLFLQNCSSFCSMLKSENVIIQHLYIQHF